MDAVNDMAYEWSKRLSSAGCGGAPADEDVAMSRGDVPRNYDGFLV